jgi:hypothetical protein
MEPYIETHKGVKFEFLDPKPEMINIEDIAHALSHQCRFTGHSYHYYSVAEHSVYVMQLCSQRNKLAGLLHDASEAYLTDVASPVKKFLSNYKEMEDKIMKAIAERFGFRYPFEEEVHDADKDQLQVEAFYLLPSKGLDWPVDRPTILEGKVPRCLQPVQIEREFLHYFREVL